MNEAIQILLADDHHVLRQGMAQVLDGQPDMAIVAQVGNGRDAIKAAQKFQPDIALLDINMPEMDGVQAARHIGDVSPDTGIIILTMYRRDEYVFEAIKAGASGYLLKEVELDELLAAIRAVAAGEAVIDPAIAGRLLAEFRRPQKSEETAEPDLAERDMEILGLLAQGLTNQAIADQLFISEKTVRNRLSLIFRKLHLENRTQAALYAMREGLAKPEQAEDE